MSLLPVAIGGDIGIYAILRDFHKQYGAKSIVLSTNATRVVEHSDIITNVINAGINDPAVLVAALIDIARQHPDETRILLTNADWYVRAILENKEELSKYYVLPHPSMANFDHLGDKFAFASVCARLGIATPREVAVDVPTIAAHGLAETVAETLAQVQFPLVAKPASSAEYFYVSFPGKKKIHHLDTPEQLTDLLGKLADAQYPGKFLVQEFVTGDETQMRSMTAYRNSRGKITLLATGRVLLEEHTPGTLGIPAAIKVEKYQDAMDSAVKFLEEIDYHGFANFDFKWDTTHKRHVFFEANPRLGRNNFYVTSGGASVAKAIVDDYIAQSDDVQIANEEVLYSVVPHKLLMRYILDPELRAELIALKKAKKTVHPLRYPGDKSFKRTIGVEGMTLNFWRKYQQYYPKPTESGF